MDAAGEQRKLAKLMTDNSWTWDTVPLRHLVQYGGMDTIIGGQLFDLLYPKVLPYAQEAIRREQKLLLPIYKMERNGIKIDEDGLAIMTEQQEGILNMAMTELEEVFGCPVVSKSTGEKGFTGINLASHVQLKAAFRKLGHPITDTQAVTFYKLQAEADPSSEAWKAAFALLQVKHATKLLSTYLYPWRRDLTTAGRIHPSFNTLGAMTGRFSSSDPNFQNIVAGPGLRDLIVPAEGSVLVVADYEQMELRQFAYYAEDERMRAAFLSGDDIYQQVADLLGVTRSIGKMITLASQYGAGWRKTKEQAIVFAFKLGQADQVPELMRLNWEELTENFHKNYKVRHLQWLTEAQAQRRGNYGEQYVQTVGGRRMRPKVMRKTNDAGHTFLIPIFKDLPNSLIQGSCADIMKDSIIALAEAGYADQMRLTVHDEIVLEVDEAEAEDVLEEVCSIMTRDEIVPPLTVTGSWAKRYSDAK